MEIRFTTLGLRSKWKHGSAEQLFTEYCQRIGHYARCQAENLPTEERFLAALERSSSRAPLLAVLLDSRGKAWSTESLAEWLRKQRDDGTQQIVFAVGPADGWSEHARRRAGLLLSLGPMTLPHELAAVVLAEQIYRAFTIIEGQPYHLGHASG